MKSSQTNFNLRSPGSYLARSYLIATVFLLSYDSTVCTFTALCLFACLFVLGLGPTLFPLPGDRNHICRVPRGRELPLCLYEAF